MLSSLPAPLWTEPSCMLWWLAGRGDQGCCSRIWCSGYLYRNTLQQKQSASPSGARSTPTVRHTQAHFLDQPPGLHIWSGLP